VLLVAALTAGCASPPAPAAPAPPRAAGACAPDRPAACEASLSAAFGAGRFDRTDVAASDRELVATWAAARAARDPADGWARAYRALAARGGSRPGDGAPAAALLAEGAAAEPARAAARVAGSSVTLVELPALPEPKGIAAAELLAAIGASSGWSLVVRARPEAAGVRVEEIVPADPLAPFTAGLAPVVRDDGALARLGSDVALEASVRRAFAHAAASRYVEAAHEADRLATLLSSGERTAEPSVRAQYALDLLASAGLTLDTPASRPAEAAAAPPSPTETPLGAFLRVRTARDEHAAFGPRSALVLGGVPAERRAALGALFDDPACAPRTAPVIEQPRDLAFVSRLSAALAHEPSDEARGQLPLPAWLERYEAALGAVERAGTAWSHLPALLFERGELSGLHPASTAYRRATELGAKHLAGLAALERAEPDRFRALAALPLAYAPGVLSDDRLRGDLVRLLQAGVADKVARAPDPSGVFEGLLAGVFAGMSYPAAIRTEHLLALQGAFAARLRGDLSQRTGWSVAGLFAADAALRAATKDRPGLSASALHVARALEEDRAIPRPALAALAASAARYAALAAGGELDPGRRAAERMPAERRAAREALRKAIAGLGAPGEAPNNVLDDVTDLCDGVVAAVAATLGDVGAPRPAEGRAPASREPKAGACKAKEGATPAPKVRRALAKLGDVRRRILGHPRFEKGDGAWVRRVRWLVTVLSDAMDLAVKPGRRPVFTIPTSDAERFAEDALREWEDREGAAAVASAYAIARDYAAADDSQAFLAASGPRLRRALGGALGWFRGSGSAGVALVDALASLKLPGEATQGADAGRTLVAYARAFGERGLRDQADLCLLGALLLSTIAHAPPPPEALALAAQQESRVDWALRFAADGERVRRGSPPDPESYAPGVRAAKAAACATADVDAPVAVMGAIRSYAAGRHDEARRALDDVLAAAEAKGLALPSVTYRYEERTSTKVLALSMSVSLGASLLEGASSFQVGLGVRSGGTPDGRLTTSFEAPDAAQAATDSARYYVYASALAAAYHFLDGDRDHATRDAHRAIAAVVGGVRLGDRRAAADGPASAVAAARGVLALDAELAAEAGMPFLAGDLWTLVRGSLSADADDAAIGAMLDPLPVGLAGIAPAEAAARRAQRPLRVLAEPLACTEAKVDRTAFEQPACDGYPLALSLRIADAVTKLPRLARSGDGCSALRALDAFLAGADKGAYDPDAFTRAVESLRADGRIYDAAVLLARHRREGHCSPALSAAARALGRSPLLGPSVRADLLSVAVNCAAASPDPRFEDDVVSLDEETRALPDPSRNLRLVLFVTDLAVHSNRFELLARLAAQPGFVARWTNVDPTAATAALLIDHAALTLTGKPIAPDAQRSHFELVCETFAPGDRAPLCDAIRALRAPSSPLKDRERVAREALGALVATGRPPAR
jgi:hypothetical protein